MKESNDIIEEYRSLPIYEIVTSLMNKGKFNPDLFDMEDKAIHQAIADWRKVNLNLS